MSRWLLLLGVALLAAPAGAEPGSAEAPEEPAAAPGPPLAAARSGDGDGRRFGVSIDRSQPLSIRSDELESFKTDGQRRFIFTRNVIVDQADLRILTDRLEAFYPKGASQPDRLIASGNVVVTQAEREVRCQQATYDRQQHRLVCRGDAEVREGQDRVRGEVIEFDLTDETVVVTGGAAVVLQPRPQDLEPDSEVPNG